MVGLDDGLLGLGLLILPLFDERYLSGITGNSGVLARYIMFNGEVRASMLWESLLSELRVLGCRESDEAEVGWLYTEDETLAEVNLRAKRGRVVELICVAS